MPKSEVFNRDYVLEKATEVFHSKGYNGTSMQDLVDATGLNRSSIYNSFENKLNLYLECLSQYQKKANTLTSDALLNANDAFEAIESVFNLFLNEVVTDRDQKGCLIVNCKSEMANQDVTIRNFLNHNQNGTLYLFEDLVAKGQAQGRINKNQTAKQYALFLFSALQGLRMTGILLNDKTELHCIVDNTLNVLK
ncbi:MAG: TetR/AcrR family transcriptional regulator [Bacteroidota bacterium]